MNMVFGGRGGGICFPSFIWSLVIIIQFVLFVVVVYCFAILPKCKTIYVFAAKQYERLSSITHFGIFQGWEGCYAPNFGKVEGACILLSARPCVCPCVRPLQNL